MDISKEDIALINRFSRHRWAEEDIYTFPIVLCNNEVDKDYERFDESTLLELRDLYLGKPGITNHDWDGNRQFARIYRTEVVYHRGVRTSVGDNYIHLRALAYLPRTLENQSLIAEIESGIKREVSVGVSVRQRICSICGKPIGEDGCTHKKGEAYDGQLCYATLHGAIDAYEWSFTASPSQYGTGVTNEQNYGGVMKLSDINIGDLMKKAVENKVEVTINLEPDRAEVQIRPWKPFEYSCPYQSK